MRGHAHGIDELQAKPVLDASPNAIAAVDGRGRILYANPQVLATFGWTPEELMGEPLERLVPTRLAEHHVGLRDAYLRDPAARPMGVGLVLTGLRRDGVEFPAEIGLVPVMSDRGPIVIATVVDITNAIELRKSLSLATSALRRRADTLEDRGREMSLLAHLGELLELCESLEDAYGVIASAAESLFPWDAGALYAIDPSRAAAEAVAEWGQPAPVRRVFGLADCWALRRNRLHVALADGTEPVCSHVEEPIVTGVLCQPLTAQADTFGLLHLQARQRVGARARGALLADRERLVATLGERLSLSLSNIRLRASLREQSLRDPLTGLFNRRYLEETLTREARRAVREGYPLSVLMADLDHFKDLNDAFGHAAGDAVLREIGRIIAELVRGEDVACRFGGEEFVVVLPKATLDNARRRADGLREQIKARQIGDSARIYPPITVSIGVAAFPSDGASVEQLILAVDSALYRAKAEGRDRVAVAGDADARGFEVATR